jgi:large subunit ribosomal protein L4
VFGPHPREYRLGLPRGIKRVALRSALSTKVGEGEVRVVADFHIAEPKTRVVAEVLKKLEVEGRKCLWVLAEHDAEFARAARNIPKLNTREYRLLNAYDVLHADCLIIMESAVSKIEEAWGS